jgi:hypothetical protein
MWASSRSPQIAEQLTLNQVRVKLNFCKPVILLGKLKSTFNGLRLTFLRVSGKGKNHLAYIDLTIFYGVIKKIDIPLKLM